jgi:hypothetical protein
VPFTAHGGPPQAAHRTRQQLKTAGDLSVACTEAHLQ